MPNETVSAAAIGLPEFTRRLFLRKTALAGTAVAIPVAGAATAKSATIADLTPDERIEVALADLISAFRARWPDAPIFAGYHHNGDVIDGDYRAANGGMIVLMTSNTYDTANGETKINRHGISFAQAGAI